MALCVCVCVCVCVKFSNIAFFFVCVKFSKAIVALFSTCTRALTVNNFLFLFSFYFFLRKAEFNQIMQPLIARVLDHVHTTLAQVHTLRIFFFFFLFLFLLKAEFITYTSRSRRYIHTHTCTHTHTDRQTDRQTDRHTHTHTHLHFNSTRTRQCTPLLLPYARAGIYIYI